MAISYTKGKTAQNDVYLNIFRAIEAKILTKFNFSSKGNINIAQCQRAQRQTIPH